MRHTTVKRILSGGQTGVDRAALDAARKVGIDHGGWCPLGRRAEDGPIPSHYELRETDSADYPIRTERNVLEADATLILYRSKLTGGTKLTRKLAASHAKPYFLHDLAASSDLEDVSSWLESSEFHTLNVAGPRESSAPGIQNDAFEFLTRLLRTTG